MSSTSRSVEHVTFGAKAEHELTCSRRAQAEHALNLMARVIWGPSQGEAQDLFCG